VVSRPLQNMREPMFREYLICIWADAFGIDNLDPDFSA